jgi:hypothetical protein
MNKVKIARLAAGVVFVIGVGIAGVVIARNFSLNSEPAEITAHDLALQIENDEPGLDVWFIGMTTDREPPAVFAVIDTKEGEPWTSEGVVAAVANIAKRFDPYLKGHVLLVYFVRGEGPDDVLIVACSAESVTKIATEDAPYLEVCEEQLIPNMEPVPARLQIWKGRGA